MLRLVATIGPVLVLAGLVVVARSMLRPAAAPAMTGDPPATSPESHLLELVNAERARAGCQALRLNGQLMASARAHAADMADRAFASSINPDQVGPEARARKAGYQGGVTEIIAVGLLTATDVITQWTNLRNPAAVSVLAKITDCSRVSAGVAHRPARIKPAFGQGIWVIDLGDA